MKYAGLNAIEWGSDVHLIPGDIENAKKLKICVMRQKQASHHTVHIFNILLKAQCENNIKEVIYNKLTSSETPTEFIGEITALDIDKNLFNAIVEILVAGEESFTN